MCPSYAFSDALRTDERGRVPSRLLRPPQHPLALPGGEGANHVCSRARAGYEVPVWLADLDHVDSLQELS